MGVSINFVWLSRLPNSRLLLCHTPLRWCHNGSDGVSQITSLTIFYSIVYSGADQRKHQSSASLSFVRGFHRWPMNSPHNGPVARKMFPCDDVIMPYRIPDYCDNATRATAKCSSALLGIIGNYCTNGFPVDSFIKRHCISLLFIHILNNFITLSQVLYLMFQIDQLPYIHIILCLLHNCVTLLIFRYTDIPWICYERSFSEFYLSIWNQLVFNQRLQLFVQSPQPYLLIFAWRKLSVFTQQIGKKIMNIWIPQNIPQELKCWSTFYVYYFLRYYLMMQHQPIVKKVNGTHEWAHRPYQPQSARYHCWLYQHRRLDERQPPQTSWLVAICT